MSVIIYLIQFLCMEMLYFVSNFTKTYLTGPINNNPTLVKKMGRRRPGEITISLQMTD